MVLDPRAAQGEHGIPDDHREAGGRDHEGDRGGGAVDQRALNQRHRRPTDDRHDRAGGAELGVLAESFQGGAVDGGG
jgi:hypothetical protein